MIEYLNKILCGESLEILARMPDNSIDVVITDPLYSSGGQTHAVRSQDPVSKCEQTSNKIVHRPTFAGTNASGSNEFI
jgi:site-specific DNA-methyltransferase (adenine-specific)